ncbi:MAG: hypothetical protein IPP71_00300 [Bacteroidetes bacterium]|nr:hypothetical protein [Bacteroidota bacterium]
MVFNTGSGKVTFSGGNSQILNGSNTFQFKKVAINKNSGFVTVNTPGSVDDTLFLIKGTFLTKATNLINLKLGAKVTGASDSSFIDGPVKKTGNTAFVFPNGANNSYRPIEITAPATTTSEFTAEFMEDSVMVNTDNRDATLSYLLTNKYWKLKEILDDRMYMSP